MKPIKPIPVPITKLNLTPKQRAEAEREIDADLQALHHNIANGDFYNRWSDYQQHLFFKKLGNTMTMLGMPLEEQKARVQATLDAATKEAEAVVNADAAPTPRLPLRSVEDAHPAPHQLGAVGKPVRE